MTSPFPTQFNNQVIQDPGTGGAIVSGLAQVLAAMQQKRENEFRQQQLASQRQQAEALAAYYQGTIGVQNRQEDRLGATAEAERAERGQVGRAVRRSMEFRMGPYGDQQVGGSLPGSIPQPTNPNAALGVGGGNALQSGPGRMGQVFGASVPSTSTDPSATAGIFEQVFGVAASNLDPHMRSAIFGDVSDENLPAAVEAVQAATPKPPEVPELPTSAKEMEYYTSLLKTDPQRAAAYKILFLDPKPSTVVNVGGKPTAFSEKWDEARVGILAEGRKQAQGAITGFPALNEAYGLADKALTGIGAGAQLNVARVLSALGVKPAKDATANTQTLQKLTAEGALTYLRSRDLGSGTAVSDADREFVLRLAGGDISLDRSSIKKVLRVNVGMGVMRIGESITDLKEQAITYPERAPQLLREAASLEKQNRPIWRRYAQMLAAEGTSIDDIRERLIRSGVSDPEAILQGVRITKSDIQRIGDDIFGPTGGR